MTNAESLWDLPMPGYWLPITFIVGAAGWSLLMIMWGVQAHAAARGTRWPAMYIHLLKTAAALLFALFFLASLVWRDPTPVITVGTFGRNLCNGAVVFALFIEAVWRLKEVAKREALANTVQTVMFLREDG